MSTKPSPLVSLIMPSYNYAGFLPLAIESALTQSHADIELIICDDASQDDSFNVAQS
jgi:glycosyltransferase involved in cell wall biosynthesis